MAHVLVGYQRGADVHATGYIEVHDTYSDGDYSARAVEVYPTEGGNTGAGSYPDLPTGYTYQTPYVRVCIKETVAGTKTADQAYIGNNWGFGGGLRTAKGVWSTGSAFYPTDIPNDVWANVEGDTNIVEPVVSGTGDTVLAGLYSYSPTGTDVSGTDYGGWGSISYRLADGHLTNASRGWGSAYFRADYFITIYNWVAVFAETGTPWPPPTGTDLNPMYCLGQAVTPFGNIRQVLSDVDDNLSRRTSNDLGATFDAASLGITGRAPNLLIQPSGCLILATHTDAGGITLRTSDNDGESYS